jgi:hypothetical protein
MCSDSNSNIVVGVSVRARENVEKCIEEYFHHAIESITYDCNNYKVWKRCENIPISIDP